MTRKEKYLLRAPVLTQSGYGVHARQIARWMLDRKLDFCVQPLMWGDTPWIIDREAEDCLIGKLMERTDTTGKRFDVTIQLQLPNEWDTSLGTRNIGVTAAVETTLCNPDWIDACKKMAAVIVPSNHTAVTLRSSGDSSWHDKLHVVSEHIEPGIVGAKPLDIDFESTFCFLIVAQMTGQGAADRKNICSTIAALRQEFSDDPSVGIIVKTNLARNHKIDAMMTERSIKEIADANPSKAQIHLLHGEMTSQEMGGMYSHPSVKALVSLTAGEGFGLPLLEAAACGLPVFATAWSGHTDFLKPGAYVPIDYRLVDIPQQRVDGKLFVKGARWASPSIVDFRQKVRKFYDDAEARSDLQRRVAAASQSVKDAVDIAKLYTLWDSIVFGQMS